MESAALAATGSGDAPPALISICKVPPPASRVYTWGPYLGYDLDSLDSRAFPEQGHYLSGRMTYAHSQGGEDLTRSRVGLSTELSLIQPIRLYERHTLNMRLSGGGSAVSDLQPMYLQDLGGLFNLSGYQRYQLSGCAISCFGAMIYAIGRWITISVPSNRRSIWASRWSGQYLGLKVRDELERHAECRQYLCRLRHLLRACISGVRPARQRR